MAPRITTNIMEVDQRMAAEWLEVNTINRPVRRSHVETLTQAFLRGEYKLTHQGIAFAVTGELLDGQHRLLAIVEVAKRTGRRFSVPMFVTKNLPADAFEVIDDVAPRSAADNLREDGGVVAVSELFFLLMNPSIKYKSTPQALVPYVKLARSQYGHLAAENRKGWSQAAVRSAVILRILKHPKFKSYFLDSYRALCRVEFSEMSPIVQVLFRQGMDIKEARMSKFARVYKALDPEKINATRLALTDVVPIYLEAREILATHLCMEPPPLRG